MDIWYLNLDAFLPDVSKTTGILSQEELAQAHRFQDQILSDRYAIAHAGLRLILSKYLDAPAVSISFRKNQYDKPFILPAMNPRQIEFNLSHSGARASVVVSEGNSVGIDIEQYKKLEDHLKIARRYFTKKELQVLKQFDPGISGQRFIQLWTAKEAFIKARGLGLSIPLNQFDCSGVISQGQLASLTIPGNRSTHWIVQPLKEVPGYAGSVAYPGIQKDPNHYEFELNDLIS